MIRHGIYDVKTVLDWAETDVPFSDGNFKEFDGLQVLSGILGYKVFKYKGTKCACCPTEGTYFALERTPGPGRTKYNNWHFNLYGKNKFGREVMLTKDHITPKSKDGTNDLENLQPMCQTCNSKKGSLHMKEFEARLDGRTHDWERDYAQHVIKRLDERYGIEMQMDEYHELLDRVKNNGEVVHNITSVKTYRRVHYKGKDVFVVYSSAHGQIYTVLDPAKEKAFMRHVPVWGKERAKEALSLYDEVQSTLVKQYKELPTHKETALYLKSCKYGNLLLAKWKGKHARVNVLTWTVVKSLMKVKASNKSKNRRK